MYEWAKGEENDVASEKELVLSTSAKVNDPLTVAADTKVTKAGDVSASTKVNEPLTVTAKVKKYTAISPSPKVESVSRDRESREAAAKKSTRQIKDEKARYLESIVSDTFTGSRPLEVAKSVVVHSGIKELEDADCEEDIESFVASVLEKVGTLNSYSDAFESLATESDFGEYLCGGNEAGVAGSWWNGLISRLAAIGQYIPHLQYPLTGDTVPPFFNVGIQVLGAIEFLFGISS